MAVIKIAGIYAIVNRANGKRYIGRSEHIERRWLVHLSELKNGRHHSFKLQAAWNKYGERNFHFMILDHCEKDQLHRREQFFLDSCKPEYNVSRTALGGGGPVTDAMRSAVADSNRRRTGWHMTEASKLKISLANTGRASPTKGKARSRDAVEKTAAAHRGRKRSLETRAKIAAAAKGRKVPPRTEEYRAKMSAIHKGRKLSPEHMAALQAGRVKRQFTDEQRAKLSESLKASYANGTRSRERPPEYREKIAASLRGRRLPQETRDKISSVSRGKKRGAYNRNSKEPRPSLLD